MQRLKKLMFALLISVIGLSSVSAAKSCSTSEIAEFNKILPNIKVNYEEREGSPETDAESGDNFIDGGDNDCEGCVEPVKYYFEINILNLTDQFYAEVTNDVDNEVKVFNYSDSKNGIITFPWENNALVTNFTIKIYSSAKTSCPGTLQKTLTLRTPRLNENYDNEICADIPDYQLCQKYVTFNYMEWNEFKDKIEKYKNTLKEPEKNDEEKEKSTWEKIRDFVDDNKYYFIGGGVVILIGAGVVVGLVVKKRRSMEL